MTLVQLAQRHPRLLDWGIRLDRAPAWQWLALLAAALAPTWVWLARRLAHGPGDAPGLLALATLAVLVLRRRHALRASPRLAWLLLALAGTVLATATRGALPAPLSGLISVLALACGLLAFLPAHGALRVPALPVVGLAVLALPRLSSLPCHAGEPLRRLTAEAGRWLLAPFFTVLREGGTLLVDGRMVIVDAPCSGVPMAWLGGVTACAAALWARRDGRDFLARLPLAGLLVLLGEVLRNSLPVAAEGAGHALAPWAHQALGLLLPALVCGGVACAMAHGRRAPLHGGRHA